MAEAIPKPTDGDVNRGPAVIAVAWAECALAIVAVGLRFWARRLIRGTGWDDWTMLFTLGIFILWCALVTDYALLGGFRHVYYLATTGANTEEITYINYIIQFVTTFSYAPAKLSVALLVMRIVGSVSAVDQSNWRKWLIIVTLTLTWIATIINCIMTYVQCDPPSALWDKTVPHHCWDPELEPHFAFFTSALNIFTDAVLAFVPASLVYNLNMDLKRRVNLCIILSLGILAAICGIVKTTFLPSLGAHADITWNTYNLIVWAGSELFVLIFCGSIPPLRPLWERYISRSGYTSKAYVGNLEGGSYDRSTHGVSQGSRHTVDRRNLAPNGMYRPGDIEISSMSSAKPLKK